MNQAARFSITTIMKKFIIALSGLGLVVYVILHLLGNLTLYRGTGDLFNIYAAQLHHLGGILTFLEVALMGVFLVHVTSAVWNKKMNVDARPVSYRKWQSKGGITPSNFSSRTMVFSGLILLAFTVIHVWQFRFGPAIEEGYVMMEKGEQIRDLHRLVVEVLKNPWMALFYMVAMVVLGFHLRHGIWSAFQSLGLTSPRSTRNFRYACTSIGVLLAVGFLFIPIWIYFG